MALSNAERQRRYIAKLKARARYTYDPEIAAEVVAEAVASPDLELDIQADEQERALGYRETGYLPNTVSKGRLAVHNQVNGSGHRTWTVKNCSLAHKLYERCDCQWATQGTKLKEHYKVREIPR
jgi:hypothetical protein